MAKKRVKVIPFPDIAGAYIVISGQRRSRRGTDVRTLMTFFFDNGNGIGAEWEPEYGPISTIYRVSKDHPQAQRHWHFPYCDGYGHWNQQAVAKYELKKAFLKGDYEYIFSILNRFCGEEMGPVDALFTALGFQSLPEGVNPKIT